MYSKHEDTGASAPSDIPITEQEMADYPGEDHEPRCCDCCGYPAPLSKYMGPVTREHGGGDPKGSMFCEICAGTFLSHYVTYPALYGNQHHLFSSIGWIANMLRDEIRRAALQTREPR